ncbi:uncharacterized protein LOC132643855 [Lycium barbarum]|uniref:uncharacterized protein LOC132643855 n=1 Tax=Lycium barbarum TaxID=112863 RepID=UPI00293EE677|nr:uncharacterized protein LOC132643855 [Lycium barbarum]
MRDNTGNTGNNAVAQTGNTNQIDPSNPLFRFTWLEHDSVIYSKTAKDLYTDLEQRFGQSNGAKLFHLQKELSDVVQGNTDVAGYFTKIKRLWDELDSLNTDNKCSCNCICGGKEKLTKSLENERLIKFLMGLNETYGAARSSIFMIKPLPNRNHAYSLLLQDENQRESYINANVSTEKQTTYSRGLGKQSTYKV